MVDKALLDFTLESQNWQRTLRVLETNLQGMVAESTGNLRATANELLGKVKSIFDDSQALARENVNCGADIIASSANVALRNALIDLQNTLDFLGQDNRPHVSPTPIVCSVIPSYVSVSKWPGGQLVLSGANFNVFGSEKPTVRIEREGTGDEVVAPNLVSLTNDYRLQINVPALIQAGKFDESARQLVVVWNEERVNPNEIPIDHSPPEAPLLADFSADRRAGLAPLTVKFQDISAGGPEHRSWDFGNGVTSTADTPTTTYTIPGLYDVQLKVFKGGFQNTKTQPGYIQVKDRLTILGCPFSREQEQPGDRSYPKLDGQGITSIRAAGNVNLQHIEDQHAATICATGAVYINGDINDQAKVSIYALGGITVEYYIQGQAQVSLNSGAGIWIKHEIKNNASVAMCAVQGIGVSNGVHDRAQVLVGSKLGPVSVSPQAGGASVQPASCSNVALL
ncbi:MAG: PKD domain-containing protein [Polyangiaceae bacterium]|nr:PKD domain-containing protein [Polyangiaceae bacterium]